MIIFSVLRATGLSVNTPKFSFGLMEIPYLGYVITREGIKYNPKKVQGVMDIGLPSTTTEDRAIIGMVQYYRNIWTRRSQILAPLTEAASDDKSGKIIWNNTLEESFKK